jgi:hypothetical protein
MRYKVTSFGSIEKELDDLELCQFQNIEKNIQLYPICESSKLRPIDTL